MSPEEAAYEQRVTNAWAGYGFVTSQEVVAALGGEAFSVYGILYSDGSYTTTPFTLSDVTVSSSLDWHQRGMFGAVGDFSRAVADNIVPFGLLDYLQGPAPDSAAYGIGSGVGLAAGILLPTPGIGKIRLFNVSRVFDDPNKVRHIFDAKHNLDRLGSPAEALNKVTKSLFDADSAGLIPTSGPFNITRIIDGHSVTVHGAVVNGELRYGTIFIP